MGKKNTSDKDYERNNVGAETDEELCFLEMENLREGEQRNPFHVPLVVTGILLFLLIAGFIGGSIYLKLLELQKKEQEVAAAFEQQEQERKTMEEAARAQAQEEVKKRLDEAKREGYAAGERDLLVHVQAQIESGSSIVEVLRLLYQDQLVVASGGKYHFIPRNNELKRNERMSPFSLSFSAASLCLNSLLRLKRCFCAISSFSRSVFTMPPSSRNSLSLPLNS